MESGACLEGKGRSGITHNTRLYNLYEASQRFHCRLIFNRASTSGEFLLNDGQIYAI